MIQTSGFSTRRLLNAVSAVWQIFLIRIFWLFKTTPKPAAPKNIVVLGYVGVGDLLMLSPALQLIKRQMPGVHITLLTGVDSGASRLAKGIPEIDRVMGLNWVGVTGSAKREAYERLRQENFDALLATATAPIRFFMPALKEVPLRIGAYRVIKFRNPWRHPLQGLRWWIEFYFYEEEIFRRLFYNRRLIVTEPPIHEIDKGLDLAEALTGTRERLPVKLLVSAENDKAAASFVDALKLQPNEFLLGLHVGASAEQMWKVWPADRYAAVLQDLFKHWPVKAVLMGTESEWRDIKKEFSHLDPSRFISAMGWSLLDTAALLKRCKLFLGNDSGIAHLSMAVGTSTIRLFGPSDQPAFAAWSPGRHRDVFLELPCRPCMISGLAKPGVLNIENCPHKNCLQQMTVPMVEKIIDDTLVASGVKANAAQN